MIALVENKGMKKAEGKRNACYLWSLPRSRLLSFILATIAVFVLMHWFFYMEENKEALKVVSRRFSWHSDVGHDQERHPNVTDILKDVISDSKRANVSSDNLCPLISPNLVGDIPVKMDVPSMEVAETEFPDVMPGGRFRPKECTSRHRVAILVPYRNRTEHLRIFAYNIHRVLSRQQIDYGVFVIEQGDNGGFNRAKLFNVGFVEATALYDYQCFIFHDVDMIPIDDRNVYTCPEKPRHMSVNVNNKSMVYYAQFFGGVSAVNKEQMLRVNGYSNKYWGWGAEDDDMSHRLEIYGYKIHRRPGKIARYATLAHVKSKPNDKRMSILKKWRSRLRKDGLNSLKYKRLDMAFKKFYTWILVDLREST
ncbi:beta-1,4-N-acetylgalactosaminyltransferase bre-4 [Rhipicephalus sanguineus]|uniref:beta-1,4-N-acetylgalactosaminyltransferase bre-4 n=1 Tax=Rhipicephalus sanguineus TaxID=34632 RepID=UPI001895B96A|nr:beta-1,4-N-acetylgalactosaminyltransferase bre-4 [Rhipicephalus sanguineus]XP_037513473.1 beta-1,4-N-acetylgalactosaminyltransferase bre-4 [Rhipicephalus sanguineus]